MAERWTCGAWRDGWLRTGCSGCRNDGALGAAAQSGGARADTGQLQPRDHVAAATPPPRPSSSGRPFKLAPRGSCSRSESRSHRPAARCGSESGTAARPARLGSPPGGGGRQSLLCPTRPGRPRVRITMTRHVRVRRRRGGAMGGVTVHRRDGPPGPPGQARRPACASAASAGPSRLERPPCPSPHRPGGPGALGEQGGPASRPSRERAPRPPRPSPPAHPASRPTPARPGRAEAVGSGFAWVQAGGRGRRVTPHAPHRRTRRPHRIQPPTAHRTKHACERVHARVRRRRTRLEPRAPHRPAHPLPAHPPGWAGPTHAHTRTHVTDARVPSPAAAAPPIVPIPHHTGRAEAGRSGFK